VQVFRSCPSATDKREFLTALLREFCVTLTSAYRHLAAFQRWVDAQVVDLIDPYLTLASYEPRGRGFECENRSGSSIGEANWGAPVGPVGRSAGIYGGNGHAAVGCFSRLANRAATRCSGSL